MILVRDVFQAKYGRGDELVTLLKTAPVDPAYRFRILADASGPFFTIVSEVVVESMGEFERLLSEEFRKPEFGPWFAQMIPLVESGRREFYHIIS